VRDKGEQVEESSRMAREGRIFIRKYRQYGELAIVYIYSHHAMYGHPRPLLPLCGLHGVERTALQRLYAAFPATTPRRYSIYRCRWGVRSSRRTLRGGVCYHAPST